MKKLILILLMSLTYSFNGQTLQNPTYGTVTIKNSPTVTSTNFLTTTESSGQQAKIDPIKLPFTDANRTGKVFQDFASYSTYSGLGLNKANSGIILVGDSNAEGYNTVGVGSQNWYNILVANLQKNQGQNSGIGFTNFSDPNRYGITLVGTTSIVSKGPTNTAIQMMPNSEIQFTASTNLVEIWMETTPGAGSLEFYYNNTLYRTVNLAGSGTINNDHTFLNGNYPSMPTPSINSGNYRIKCIGSNCTITALFKDVKFSEGFDTYFFLRDAVAGKTFGDFDITDIKETTGLGGDINSLYLINLGTNSIYAPAKATTSTQFGTDLTNYINGIKSEGKNVIYIMPPLTLGTTFPPVLEPYINYFNIAKSVCKTLGVEFIDLNGIFNYSLPSVVFGSDGLHYSTMGHDVIAKYMIHALANVDVDSYNLLQQFKSDNPNIVNGTGTNNVIPKKTGTNTYGDSRISDNGSEILLNGTVRIPSNTALQFGTPTATNFSQQYFDSSLKQYTLTNSAGAKTLTINDNNLNATFGGTVSGSSAVLSTEFTTFGQVNALARPYKVYTALLTQTGTSAPTATILENTLGGTVTLSRTGSGAYKLTLPSTVTPTKVGCFFSFGGNNSTNMSSAITIEAGGTYVQLATYNSGTQSDALMTTATVEIRVYN